MVIPTFNRAGLLERAIDSALAQAPAVSVEVIVVDDGSTDDTLERLAAYEGRIVVVAFGENRGRNHARNAGLHVAKGEWVKFLDSDDLLEPGALVQEVVAGRTRDVDIVATSWRMADLGGGKTTVRKVAEFERGIDSVLKGEALTTSAALYRRTFIADVDWDTTLHKLDDWDYFIRAYFKGARMVSLPVVSYTWVSHEGQGIRQSTLLENAREHHSVLRRVEALLSQAGQLTEPRKKRLAQYFYKQLRVFSLHDRDAFDWAIGHILELDPDFQPRDEERHSWIRALSSMIGFRNALLLHAAAKKALRRG